MYIKQQPSKPDRTQLPWTVNDWAWIAILYEVFGTFLRWFGLVWWQLRKRTSFHRSPGGSGKKWRWRTEGDGLARVTSAVNDWTVSDVVHSRTAAVWSPRFRYSVVAGEEKLIEDLQIKKKSRERKGYRSHQLQEDEVEKLPNRVEPQTWSRHGWIVSGKMDDVLEHLGSWSACASHPHGLIPPKTCSGVWPLLFMHWPIPTSPARSEFPILQGPVVGWLMVEAA